MPKCSYCGSHHPHWQCPAYGKMCSICGKTKHFKVVCRSNNVRWGTVEDTEQEGTSYNWIDTENINSISFVRNGSMIVEKCKTSSNQNSTIIHCRIDTGCDGNVMPGHILKIYFPRTMKEQLGPIRNKKYDSKNIQQTTITQLGICKVKNGHNNKKKNMNSL